MEICNLPNKNFKISVLRKLNDLQENTERQFNKIRKTIHEQNEKFSEEKEIIKYKQNPDLNNTMSEMKIVVEDFIIKLNQAQEGIYELEDRSHGFLVSGKKN